MIDVKNLSKSFGDHLVLDDISEHIYPGEKVVVYFSMIATDTDYSFWSDDVSFQQDYKVSQGYIFTFGMPEHDVTLHFSARNSMIREIR